MKTLHPLLSPEAPLASQTPPPTHLPCSPHISLGEFCTSPSNFHTHCSSPQESSAPPRQLPYSLLISPGESRTHPQLPHSLYIFLGELCTPPRNFPTHCTSSWESSAHPPQLPPSLLIFLRELCAHGLHLPMALVSLTQSGQTFVPACSKPVTPTWHFHGPASVPIQLNVSVASLGVCTAHSRYPGSLLQ